MLAGNRLKIRAGASFSFSYPQCSGEIHLTCVLYTRHPYSFHGIFLDFIKQKTKKMHFGSKFKIRKKKFFSMTLSHYSWTPMLTKSQNPSGFLGSNYIQIWSIWYFFRITQSFRKVIFAGFPFRCSGAETRLASASRQVSSPLL